MFRFLTLVLVSGWLMPQIAGALTVRTLAFGLPADKVILRVISDAAEDKDKDKAKAKPVEIEVCVNQFGVPTPLAAGAYVAESTAFTQPARFVLPEDTSGSYLLLVLPKSDGGCMILPVADDPSHFRKGNRFVINATGEDLAIRIHTQKHLLKPGRSAYYHLPPPPVPEDRIEVEMLHQVDGSWLSFLSTYWPLAPNQRSIVMIYPDPDTGRPRVKSLADRALMPVADAP